MSFDGTAGERARHAWISKPLSALELQLGTPIDADIASILTAPPPAVGTRSSSHTAEDNA